MGSDLPDTAERMWAMVSRYFVKCDDGVGRRSTKMKKIRFYGAGVGSIHLHVLKTDFTWKWDHRTTN